MGAMRGAIIHAAGDVRYEERPDPVIVEPTDAVIRTVAAKDERVVFVLWGSAARKKSALIDTSRHVIIESAHPSPLSAHNGFFGSRPFSRTNAALEAAGREPIDWRLPP